MTEYQYVDALNYLVDEFLRATDYDYLMFIDSDITFNPEDVISLAALCDPEKHPIIGGPYPKKTISWEKIKRAVDRKMKKNKLKYPVKKFKGRF